MGKIKSISFELRNFEYFKPFHITNSVMTQSTNLEIVLETENGVKGYGEASPSFRVNGERVETFLALEKYINDSLRGFDVKDYGKIFDVTDKLFAFPSVKAGIQYAVLDALSQEAGIGVHQILGGSKDRIETDKTVGIDSIDNMVKDAKEIFEEGFRILKIKVGENLKEDIEKIIKIHEVTKGSKYIVDANMGYSPKEAVEFVKEIYKSGIEINIFEQPVKAQDIEGLKFVRFNSPFPVAADESAKTKYDAMRLIKQEAVDYINIKLMKSGISDALAIVEMAKSANLGLMIGCMGESSVGINQSVNFALGTGAFDFHDLDSSLMLKEDGFKGKYKVEIPYYYRREL